MNVFVLDKDMEKSAQMLDDAHLKAQINEGCMVLMANYNHKIHPSAKIGHVNHPVTKFYADEKATAELFVYLAKLCHEYYIRFKKEHQNLFWIAGFKWLIIGNQSSCDGYFMYSKTYVNGVMTDDIEVIRHYISTKPQQKKPVWTGREKPDWWEV